MEHDRTEAHPDVRGRFTTATVVTSNVNRASREHDVSDHYDVVLDVIAERQPIRVHLHDVALGPMLPMIGTSVTVRLADGAGDPVVEEIMWRGDPNLDVDAHRQQLAALADSARRRREHAPLHDI